MRENLVGWKIKNSKIMVVFLCGFIVSLRGFEFIIKIADLLSLAIDPNRGSPFLRLFVVPDASIS
jgi:hypothetical protein